MSTILHKNSILKRKSFVILGASGKCNFKMAVVSSIDAFKNCITSLQNHNKKKENKITAQSQSTYLYWWTSWTSIWHNIFVNFVKPSDNFIPIRLEELPCTSLTILIISLKFITALFRSPKIKSQMRQIANKFSYDY